MRQQLSKESGYTGLSLLHRLYYLYGFLYDRHLVYDEMHTIHLNIVKNTIQDLKGDEDNVVNWATLDEHLNSFPWTPEFKSSRIPKNIEKRLGCWKAEDFNKFAFPASEVVLQGSIFEDQQEEWLCIARRVEFIQNHSRNGWTENDADTFQKMALRYAVLLEDRRGPTACHMIVYNLLHFKKDTMNFSGQDNFSCWNKERAVRRYVRQTNNRKNIECTLANTEERRETIKFRSDTEQPRPDPQKTDPNKLWAKSIEQAKQLYAGHEQVHHQSDATGILVGGARTFTISGEVRQAVSAECHVQVTDIEPGGTQCRSAWFPSHTYDGLLYRENEHAIIIDQDGERTSQLLNLFSAFVVDKWKLFFKAKKFQEEGFSNIGMKLVSETDDHIVGSLESISRKVTLLSCGNDETGKPLFAVIDFMRRIFPIRADTVVVPYYPVRNDMVLVKGDDGGALWKARILASNLARRIVIVQFFEKPIERIWIPERSPTQDVHLNSVIGIDFDGDWMTPYT